MQRIPERAAEEDGQPCEASAENLGEPLDLEGRPARPRSRGSLQAAYDDQNLYLRFQWPTQFDRPGQMHDYMRYNGEGWEFYGGAWSEESVRSDEEPPLYEDRLAIMIDDPRRRHRRCFDAHAIIRKENAVPHDPEAGWQEGDVLPGRLLSREDAADSAAGNSDAQGSPEDGVWAVTCTSPLDTGHPRGRQDPRRSLGSS